MGQRNPGKVGVPDVIGGLPVEQSLLSTDVDFVSSSLPDLTDDSTLPPGDYEVTFEELRALILVEGPGSDSIRDLRSIGR